MCRPVVVLFLFSVALSVTIGVLFWPHNADPPEDPRLPPSPDPVALPLTPDPDASGSLARLAAPVRTGPPALANIPPFMLPAGTASARVPMGTSAKRALALAKKFYPYNEKLALRLLRNVSSELGEFDAKIDAFFLSKFAITNEQYLRYVEASGHRFPFHWWKFGEQAHYQASRKNWLKAFPELERGDRGNASMYYWEDYWKSAKLPYAIPEGAENHPVTFVSWGDAMAFAVWAGMRLPSEVEWTFAANGGVRREFVFGDEWSDAVLDDLGMANMRDAVLKPVGALGATACGPFGHGDMVGQVWEWVMPPGYTPQAESKTFHAEYESLRENTKYGKRLAASPHFRPDLAIAKGGSFYTFSNMDYVQARINCRAPLDVTQTTEGLGFRVAKTRRAAYDMSISRLRIDYPAFAPETTQPDFARQVGVERYDLAKNGSIIAGYHAVSFVPFDSMTRTENAGAIPLGVLITTEMLEIPALDPGLYVVYLRMVGAAETAAGVKGDRGPFDFDSEKNLLIFRHASGHRSTAAETELTSTRPTRNAIASTVNDPTGIRMVEFGFGVPKAAGRLVPFRFAVRLKDVWK